MSGVFDLRFDEKVKAAVAEKKRKETEFAEAVQAELARESEFFAERIWGIANEMVCNKKEMK
tara:strand:+ start:4235 stop:4420 length:186 start_codon:yes stop_codon:yes gene_type:complete